LKRPPDTRLQRQDSKSPASSAQLLVVVGLALLQNGVLLAVFIFIGMILSERIALGYLYWRHGLEAAMLGQMSAHVVLQAPGAMLPKNML
jgi:hypothetical protein